jgi:hypothetical protein
LIELCRRFRPDEYVDGSTYVLSNGSNS